MHSERWEQIGTLFFEALEREGAEREAFLDEACAGDPALREEIQEMLAAHEHSPGLLLEKRLLTGDADVTRHGSSDGMIGTRIGPYRLKSLLAEGGMGVVYLAARADTQYRQDVALKLIRPGLHTTDIVTRFRVERQILARLQHPNIARLLDGGMTDDAQPYLVMEFVEGTPITQFCDAHRLSVAERLRLFITICRAVQFAHRNLVVHRDLKPTNILASEDGDVKLLDFGIAKLLDPESAGLTIAQTHSELRVMTPEYGAPEQVRGEAITTATDIYALGVLLYELLTGHRPYRLQQRRPSEVERIICEEEPTRPSTVVAGIEEIPRSDGTTISVTPERVSADRATQPARLRRTLQGDLDNIVMMALRKEPERRYASADQLAEDVNRYLNKQVVIARKDTLAYRMTTFVRRHRAAVGAAAVVLVLLVGFSLVTIRQAGIVARERDIARAERDRTEQALLQAEEVSEFLMGMFEANDPAEARGDTITARELLERGETRAGELAGQPSVQARMLDLIGQMYRRLGQYDRARPLIEQAITLWRSLQDTTALAGGLNHLGVLLIERGKFDDAEAALREAYTMQTDHTPDARLELAETMHNLGGLAAETGDHTAADTLFRAALDVRKALLGPDHPLTIRTMRLRARGLSRFGSAEDAEKAYREVLAQQRKLFGNVHPDVAVTLNDLAIVLKEQGDLDAAGSLYKESLELRRAIYGDLHPRVAVALVNNAKLTMEQGVYDAALEPLTEALSIFRTIHGPDHPDVAWALENLARAYASSGAHDRAISAFREALSIQNRTLGTEHPRTATTMVSLARALVDVKHFREAEQLYSKSLAIYRDTFGEEHAEVASVYRHLALLYQRQRRFADAEQHYQLSIDLYRQTLPPGHLRTASALISYGAMLLETGSPTQAEPLLREGLTSREAGLAADSRLVADARQALAACLIALNRTTEAEIETESIQLTAP